MFQSIEYLRYDGQTDQYIYFLTDSDFTAEIRAGAGEMNMSASLIKEYQKRNINPAPQIALWNKWAIETYGFDIFFKENKEWYNRCYPKLTKEFYQYEEEINKLLLLS